MLDRITEMTGQAGLARYEISAYARPGHACFHNTNYWQFGDYLGLGAGAHSKLSFAHRVVRQTRFRDPRLYMDNALAGRALAQDEDVAGPTCRLNSCSMRCACARVLPCRIL
jgi:oxygen-independent coproporphyrinogen-3 oxidase